MGSIYKEPFEQKKESKWGMGVGKDGVKAEITNTAEEAITTAVATTATKVLQAPAAAVVVQSTETEKEPA